MTAAVIAVGAYGTWLLYTGLALGWPTVLPGPLTLPNLHDRRRARLTPDAWRHLIAELRTGAASGIPVREALVVAAAPHAPQLAATAARSAERGGPGDVPPVDDPIAAVVLDLVDAAADGGLDALDGALAALSSVIGPRR